MTTAVSGALYAVVLAASWVAAPHTPGDPRADRHRPVATVTALVVVGVPTLIQLALAPRLLDLLERNWAEIGSGQVWRLITSLVVQDGGLPGAAFNLVSLAVIGFAAEAVWGWRRWLLVALTAGIGAQFWGWIVQPVGGGNSVAVFGLAASLAVIGLRSGDRTRRLAGIVCLLASGYLLITGDIHGGAAALGALTAAALSRSVRR